MQKLILVLWPSFWVAAVAEVVFFTVINPAEFYLFGAAVSFSPLATYSIGFFCFWALCAAACAACLFYQRSAADINHLPPRI
ncbi:hypothetical protein OPU71_12980 [Niveibacterium sp. 24ML]|uniref:hypothetical protein n=1 Tax=Niveibacterium sp. 24ML TaxID=2985512 RepID=UPI0022717FDA|nr:hypothetical protein [Niveibacterium sp. 24ML]MCX9157039.1 hypothetical protein [Niveibacterium sp. 24ML]